MFLDLLVVVRTLPRGLRQVPEAEAGGFCSGAEAKAVHPEAPLPLARTRRRDHVETWRDFYE